MFDVRQFGASRRIGRNGWNTDRTTPATVQAQRGQLCNSGGSSEFEKFAASEILHRPRVLDALSLAKVGLVSKFALVA